MTGIPTDLLPTLGDDASHSRFGPEMAERIVREHYGIDGTAEPLSGERDENYCIVVDGRPAYVFKFPPLGQEALETDLFVSALRHVELAAPDLPIPRMIANSAREFVVDTLDDQGGKRSAMMCSFLPGTPLIEVPRHSRQRSECGALLARLAVALRDFTHPAMRRGLAWDLQHLPRLAGLLPRIGDLPFENFVRMFLDDFTRDVAPALRSVPQQFVHNDFNARNIIVDTADSTRIAGVIDFGDAVFTARAVDVAVGVIGQLATPEEAPRAMQEFVDAYCAVVPLDDEELRLLDWLVAGRIVQNVIMTSWYRNNGPNAEHFADFGAAYFEWRIDFAASLIGRA